MYFRSSFLSGVLSVRNRVKFMLRRIKIIHYKYHEIKEGDKYVCMVQTRIASAQNEPLVEYRGKWIIKCISYETGDIWYWLRHLLS